MSGTVAKPRVGKPTLWSFDPFELLGTDVGEMMRSAWGEEDRQWLSTLKPNADVTETEKAYEVTMDVPGVAAKDIEVKLDANVLTVRASRQEEKTADDKDKKIHRVERRSGTYVRSFTLPQNVAEDEVVAEYTDGVLKVTLPKSESEKARRIQVKG